MKETKVWVFWDGPKPHPVIELCLDTIYRHAAQNCEITLLNVKKTVELLPELEDPAHPWFKVQHWAQRVDYIRSRILHKFGGVFLDADVIVFQSPTKYFEILAEKNPLATLLGEGVEASNDMSVGLLVAKPQCPILKKWMDLQHQALFHGNGLSWETLGRLTLNQALKSGGGAPAVYLNRADSRPFPWDQHPNFLKTDAVWTDYVSSNFPAPIVWPLYWSQLSKLITEEHSKTYWFNSKAMLSGALRYALLTIDTLPTFYINLDSSLVRRESVERVLKRENLLTAKRWVASTPADDQVKEAKFAETLSAGERGCAMSHYCLWKFLVDQHYEHALILEDDVMFRQGWKDILNVKLCTLPETDPNWDLIYLHMFSPEELPYNRWSKVTGQYCTTAYIISQAAAKYLVETFANEPLVQSDHMLQRLQLRGHSYGYFPWLALARPVPSEIIRINGGDAGGGGRTTDTVLKDHQTRLQKLKPEDRNVYE